jgi:hypothetical protein
MKQVIIALFLALLCNSSFAQHQHNMQEMPVTKAKETNTKTIVNNNPPKTVRYDLYITDTIVPSFFRVQSITKTITWTNNIVLPCTYKHTCIFCKNIGHPKT